MDYLMGGVWVWEEILWVYGKIIFSKTMYLLPLNTFNPLVPDVH